MPYGEQFDNTYHFDGDDLHIFARVKKEGFHDQLVHMTFNPEEIAKHQAETGEHPLDTISRKVGGLRGTLFSPYAMTGTKDDPLYTPEERKSVIQKAFQLTPEQYSSNILKFGKARPARDIPKDISHITNIAYESGIPNHIFSQIDNPVVLREMGRSGTSFVARGRNSINNTEKGMTIKSSFVQPVERQKVPAHRVDTDNPIKNPDWLEHIREAVGKVYEKKPNEFFDYKDPVGNHGFFIGRTYTTVNRMEDGDRQYHLFPGKGKETDEYSTQDFRITIAGKSHAIFHARYPKKYLEGHTMQVEVPTGPKELMAYGGHSGLAQSAVVHESGHLLDPNIDYTKLNTINKYRVEKGADPVREAIADGIGDRYHNYRNSWESDLQPSERRQKEIDDSRLGYSPNHWKNLLHQAVYVAVRQHVAMGDNNLKDMPMLHDLAKETYPYDDPTKSVATSVSERPHNHTEHLQLAHKSLLGYLYTNHKHVRDILDHFHLGDVGRTAAEHYKAHVTDAARSYSEDDGEWPTLF